MSTGPFLALAVLALVLAMGAFASAHGSTIPTRTSAMAFSLVLIAIAGAEIISVGVTA